MSARGADGAEWRAISSAISSAICVFSRSHERPNWQSNAEKFNKYFLEYCNIFSQIVSKSACFYQKVQEKALNRFDSELSRLSGGRWIRTIEGIASRFTVCPLWPLGNSPIFTCGAGGRTRTPDLLITNQLLYQLSYTSKITSSIIIPNQYAIVNIFFQKITFLFQAQSLF